MLICASLGSQLLALVGIRKGLERIFSLHDLSWLDSLLPETARKEADGKQSREQEESNSEEVGDVLDATFVKELSQLSPGTLGCGG